MQSKGEEKLDNEEIRATIDESEFIHVSIPSCQGATLSHGSLCSGYQT